LGKVYEKLNDKQNADDAFNKERDILAEEWRHMYNEE
jgi:hypothetical protein